MLPPYYDWDAIRPRHRHSARRRGSILLLLGGLALVAAGSCVYDGDHRCGPHQVLNTDDLELCVCDEHSAATADGCVPCAAHEVPGATGCECETGYARPSPNKPCTKAETSGTGGTTSSGGQTGTNSDAGTTSSAGEGGTTGGETSSCDSDDDCTDGDVCNTKLSPSVCVKRPEGLGKACTGNADCAGTEATFCDMIVTKACAVEGCSLDPDNCLPGYTCCDLSGFGIPTTLCSFGACL
jgi:hypothetical protein